VPDLASEQLQLRLLLVWTYTTILNPPIIYYPGPNLNYQTRLQHSIWLYILKRMEILDFA